MKVEIVFIILVIALVKGNELSDDTEVTKNVDQHVAHTSTPGGKRWKPDYQKNIHRFTVTTKSTIPRSTSSHFYKPSNRPVTFKINPTIKAKNTNFWKMTSTRRPFMKHLQFTMNPLSTTKNPDFSNNEKDIGRRYKSILFNKKDDADDSSSEEMSETSNISKQNKEKYSRPLISPLRRLRTKVLKSKKLVDISKSEDSESKTQLEVTTKNSTSEPDISSEELEDREEFIFVKPKEIKQNAFDILKDNTIESDEATTVKEQETKVRRKRSVNVIEEENLATTVSGFKFTGKIAPLSSDLIFRNINT